MIEFTPLTSEQLKAEATKFKSPENGVYKMKILSCFHAISQKSDLPMFVVREASLLTITENPKDAYSYLMKGNPNSSTGGVYYIPLSPKAHGLFALAMVSLGLEEKYRTGKTFASDLEGAETFAVVVRVPVLAKGEVKKYARIQSIHKNQDEAQAALRYSVAEALDKEKEMVSSLYKNLNSFSPETAIFTSPEVASALPNDEIPF